MSSGTRTTVKGGKGAKTEKSHKNDKGDVGKGSGDKQHSNRDTTSKFDDSVKEKVKLLVEMSQKPEDEVFVALHECDYDANQAINMLLENESGVMGEWETRVKKKKNRQASAGKQDKGDESGGADDWTDLHSGGGGGGGAGDKDKRRDKAGGPARLHGRHNDGRGWRGRERQENDRNLEDGGRGDMGRERRGGRGGGPSSRGGAGGARGRGGGRAGGRFPPRGNRSGTFSKPIETWDNSNTWDNSTAAGNQNTEENWNDFPGTEEWTTEEYTGSLADTKVFTPSVPPVLDSIPDGSGTQPPVESSTSQQQLGQGLQLAAQTILPSQSPVPPIVGSLNAAQTQYLSQLTQQNSDSLNKQFGGGAQNYQGQTFEKSPSQGYNSAAAAAAQQQQQQQTQSYSNAQQQFQPTTNYVNSNYAPVNNYGGSAQEQQPPQQPVRTKTQRARVPPPSKIPSSAVEMPGDLNSNIGFLDVQFGAMDFIENNSFEGVNDHKYNTNSNSLENSAATPSVNLDLNATNQNTSLDSFSPKTQNQSSISSALSQGLSNTDNIPQTSEHLSSSYNTAPRNTQGGTGTVSAATAGIDLNKQSDSHSYSQQSSYNSYQSKTNSYNSSTYSGTQTTSSSYVSNQSNNYVNNQSGSYNSPSSANSYPNYSSATSYQSNANATAFPSISQANSYPSNNQNYAQNTSQSVYATNAGLNNSSNYGNTSTSQYNNYSSGSNHKLVKDSTYDNASSAVSSTSTTTNNVTSSTTSLSLSQTTVSSSKTTTTLAAKNSSSSVVSNIPPGVTPVMSTQYIMGQVPYFQQPVYSFEDMQMLQQRLPHMTAPYYDMSYQTPTTLPTVRDAAIGNVGGYSLSDGRFTRGDNNASPVPSTLAQQTSTLTPGHQAQPILAGGAPPYFFAPTAFNTIATNYQFGTMYTQLPAGTNAHGTSNSNQYPKPGTYGSGYGAYDALSQTQDYNKGSYVTNAQGQKGSGGNASSTGSAGNDLSGMYGKSHTALGKVNSYEKQGFHSGTPPPFTGALHGSQNAGLAPSGTGYGPQVYIPTMGPHQQHHSTPLMHQPHLQDSGNSSGQRTQASNQAKAGSKQSYPTSYWNPA